jgi:hypothetical protein
MKKEQSAACRRDIRNAYTILLEELIEKNHIRGLK